MFARIMVGISSYIKERKLGLYAHLKLCSSSSKSFLFSIVGRSSVQLLYVVISLPLLNESMYVLSNLLSSFPLIQPSHISWLEKR